MNTFFSFIVHDGQVFYFNSQQRRDWQDTVWNFDHHYELWKHYLHRPYPAPLEYPSEYEYTHGQLHIVKSRAPADDMLAAQWIQTFGCTTEFANICLEAVLANPFTVSQMAAPLEWVQLAAVRACPMAIEAIMNPTAAVQLSAIAQDPRIIRRLKNPCDVAVKAAKPYLEAVDQVIKKRLGYTAR